MQLLRLVSEPRGLASRMMWLAVAKGITVTLSFALPFILVRKLSQTEFGLYKQAFQILMTATSLLGLQVAASVYYFMPREPKKHPQIAQNVFLIYLLAGSVVALLFAFYPAWTITVFHHEGLVGVTPMLGVAILFWLTGTSVESIMIANHDVRLASLFTLISQLSKVVMLLTAALVWGTIEALIIAAVIQGVLLWGWLFFYLRYRYHHFLFPIDWQLFKGQIGNALPFGVGGLAAVMQADLHNYFVSYHFTPAEFAIYATGCFQLPLISVLFDAVETVLTPEVGRLESKQNHEQISLIWLHAIRQLALFFIPVCVLLFVVRYEFIVVLFTKNYAASVPIFAVNLIGVLLFLCIYMPVMRNFAEFKFFRIKLYLVLLPLSCLALYGGIKFAGLIGAITAVVLLRALDVSACVIVIVRKLKISWRGLTPLAALARTVVAAALAAAVTYGVKFLLMGTSEIITLLVCSLIFSVVFVSAAFLTGAITEQEKIELRKLWLRFFAPYQREPTAKGTAEFRT